MDTAGIEPAHCRYHLTEYHSIQMAPKGHILIYKLRRRSFGMDNINIAGRVSRRSNLIQSAYTLHLAFHDPHAHEDLPRYTQRVSLYYK